MRYFKGICQTILALGLATTALAATAQEQPGQGPQRPPREAVEACAKSKDGDVCSFTGRNSESIKGTCKMGPRGEKAACVPDNKPDASTNVPEDTIKH